MVYDVALYMDDESVVMVPKTETAKKHFVDVLHMPKDCDGLDITEIGPMDMLEFMPRQFLFTNTSIVPKKTHKYLLP